MFTHICIGKTLEARRLCTGPYYQKPSYHKWWCGYEYEEFVIIDNLTPESAALLAPMLMELCSTEITKVPLKGASISIRPKTIIVTTQSMNASLAST